MLAIRPPSVSCTSVGTTATAASAGRAVAVTIEGARQLRGVVPVVVAGSEGLSAGVCPVLAWWAAVAAGKSNISLWSHAKFSRSGGTHFC